MVDFRHNLARVLSVAGLACMTPQAASAAVIQGLGSPMSDRALNGGTVVTFETGSASATTLRTYDIVSIINATQLDNYSGRYNTIGRSLGNDRGATSTIILNFSTPVSAFGFNLGASNASWSISAAGQTYTFPSISSSNNMEYYGISGAGIRSATLSFGSGDWVLIDNLTYVAAVPEPTTWALMLVGFGLTGAAMRRRASQRPAQALA